MINGIKAAKRKNLIKLLLLLVLKKNYSSKNSDINFWINSKKHNIIENSHKFYLLMIVDLMKKFTK